MKTLLITLGTLFFGKLITDNLPSLHRKDLIRYAGAGFIYLRFALVMSLMLILYKLKRLSPEAERVFAIILVVLVAAIAINHYLKQKDNQKLLAQ